MRRSCMLTTGAALLIATACAAGGNDVAPRLSRSTAPGSTDVIMLDGSTLTIPAGHFYALSDAIPPGGTIPSEFSCGGASVPWTWKNVPAGTAELALSVVDQSAGGFVQWIVTGIAPVAGSIAKGEVPPNATQLPNDFGNPSWYGPCPQSGEQPHNYVFTIYVLPQPSKLSAGTAPKDAVKQLHSQAHGSAVFTATFSR